MKHAARCLCAVALAGLIVAGDAGQASAQSGHPGRVVARFRTDSDERVVGTGMDLAVRRLLVDPGHRARQQFSIQHDILTNRGRVAKVVGGYFNEGPTNVRHATLLRAFVWSDLAGLVDTGHEAVSINWFTGRPGVRLRLAIRPGDTCLRGGSPGCGTVDYVLTRRVLSHWSEPTLLNVGTLSFSDFEFPVRVVAARHGLWSTDAAATNDVHLSLSAHTALAVMDGKDCLTCGASWDRLAGAHEVAWSGVGTEDDKAAGVLVYAPAQSELAWSRDVCLGKSPGTPCGCGTCPYPAASPNERWQVKRPAPILWYIDPGTLPAGNGWTAAAEAAAAEWNEHVGFEALRRTGDRSKAMLRVEGENPWRGRGNSVAEYRDNAREVSTSDWPCPIQDGPYKQNTLGYVLLRTDETVEWDTEAFLASARFNGGKTRIWRQWVLIHEFGHALGLGHGGVAGQLPRATRTPSPTETFGTPQPTATPTIYRIDLPAMVSPLPGYPLVRVRVTIATPFVEGVQCLFYRR